jgi:hypothetical protein
MAWLKATLAERVIDALAGAEPPAATRLRHQDLLARRPSACATPSATTNTWNWPPRT